MSNVSKRAGNSRLGLRLFFVYTVFYAGFVLVNAFAAEWVDWVPFGGLNLAVLWGFSLIVLAFVLAMIYGIMCVSEEPTTDADTDPHTGEASR